MQLIHFQSQFGYFLLLFEKCKNIGIGNEK